MSPDPLGGDPSNPQSLNRYAYAFNNPVGFIDPSGMDSCSDDPYDPSCGGCAFDPICSGGIGIDLGTSPSPPPDYEPPASNTSPNPPAGDPDANGPFSGPIWQEGGPQIPPTGNLAVLLGVPDPSLLIIDNFTEGTVWGHNSAWWKAFFSNFLGNFGSWSFYGQEVADGGCINTFGRATLSALNPAVLVWRVRAEPEQWLLLLR